MELLDRMLGHDEWATTALLKASQGLSDAQLDQPFDIGNGSLRATFDHIILNIDFWTGVMIGQEIEYKRPASSVSTLVEDYTRANAAFADLARRVRDEGRLEATFVDHFSQPMTFGGAILHVILHNDEHRTEAVHILQRLGALGDLEVDHGLWDFKRRGF